MRLLGAVRLSSLTDETTSPERQKEQINLTAKARGDTVTHITEDLDVSGAVDPFKRDQLGPWLTDPKLIEKWDGIIVAKLDRLTRSLLDFQRLLEWCAEHNKTIISVSEGFDLSTPVGKLIANILVMFAEFERERMAERRREAKGTLDQAGKWNGGTIPFGRKAVKTGDGWLLCPDPVTAPIVRQMADDIISGKSAQAIARSLHERDIPTSQGGQWRQSAIVKILRSPTLKGYVMSNGKIVRGADGMPVKIEPILSDETWAKVQAALDKSAKNMPANREDASLLLRVAFCACGQPMYIQRKSNRPHAYYYCATKTTGPEPCSEKSWIRSDVLETYVSDKLLEAVGNVPMRIKDTTPAEDHTAELADVHEAISNLMSDRYERGLFTGETGAQRYAEMMSKLEARQIALEALPSHRETVDWVKTGQTFAEYWHSLTNAQGHAFLLDAEVILTVETVDALDIELAEEGYILPMPDPTGRVVMGYLDYRGKRYRVTIHLGDLADLRDLASQA